MSEEENKAVERCKELIKKEHSNWIGITNQEAIETVLNLLEKKDKIIEEMAGYLAVVRDCPNENHGVNIDCENRCSNDDDIYEKCWKIYFERQVKDVEN